MVSLIKRSDFGLSWHFERAVLSAESLALGVLGLDVDWYHGASLFHVHVYQLVVVVEGNTILGGVPTRLMDLVNTLLDLSGLPEAPVAIRLLRLELFLGVAWGLLGWLADVSHGEAVEGRRSNLAGRKARLVNRRVTVHLLEVAWNARVCGHVHLGEVSAALAWGTAGDAGVEVAEVFGTLIKMTGCMTRPIIIINLLEPFIHDILVIILQLVEKINIGLSLGRY